MRDADETFVVCLFVVCTSKVLRRVKIKKLHSHKSNLRRHPCEFLMFFSRFILIFQVFSLTVKVKGEGAFLIKFNPIYPKDWHCKFKTFFDVNRVCI